MKGARKKTSLSAAAYLSGHRAEDALTELEVVTQEK